MVGHEGAIGGLLVLRETSEGFLLDTIAVRPGHHGTSLGRRFLELAEDSAREAGRDSIYIYTQEIMAENQALYTRIGYVEYARRHEVGLDRVYMRKQFASGA